MLLIPSPAATFAQVNTVAPPSRVDRLHGIVGSSVRGLADRLDRFFSDERSLAEEQQSSMRLTPTVEWIEAGGSAVTLPINARLVLPRLEDKLRLQLVTGDDDASDVAGEEEAPPENISDDTDESRTFLGLVYTSIAEQARNISVRGGLRARDGALKAAASVRGRFTKPIGIWTARLTQTFFYDGDEFGERTVVDFDHPIDRATLFRSATGVTVTESSEGAELLQRFLLRRLLAEHTGVEFFVASEGHTDPVVVADRHITGLTYRKRVWKDWLTLSVRPELRYPRDLDFDREAAFIVALEAVF